MDSSALKYDPSEYSQVRWAIENNKRSYSTVKELIADFELVNKLGIEINFANRLITSSQNVLSHFKLEDGFKSNDFQGILEALLKIPEDLKDEKIQDLLRETTVKQESVVFDKETLKELEAKQVDAEVKKSESSVQRETANNNVKTFLDRQREIAKEQRNINIETATKTGPEEIIPRDIRRTEETAEPKLEVVKSRGKSGIEKLVEQNTKRAETKIQGLGVTAEQGGGAVKKTFRQQKPIIFPHKEVTNLVIKNKVEAKLAEVVNGLDIKEKIERKGKSVAEDWITNIKNSENISDHTKGRLEFSRSKIEQAVINSLSGRDLQTGEVYTNTFSNEVVSVLPELTETELSTVKFEARGVEEEISSLIKGNPELINTYRGEIFEEVFDKKIVELNPNLTQEQSVVANNLKDFIKPFVNNPVDSFGKEITAEASVGGENAANAAKNFEFTKMTVGLVTGQEKVENIIERFELLKQRATKVDLNIKGLADVDRLQGFFSEIKTDNNLMSYFNRAQGWTSFIQKADKFTGGFVTRIFPKIGNFLNNGISGGFRVFAQNTFGLISKNGLGNGLKMAMGNFLGNGLKLGASVAGKAVAGGVAQTAVSALAGAATGGIGAAVIGGLSFLKNILQGKLGDALGNFGKAGIGVAATLLGPALAGALASATAAAAAATGPIIIGVFAFLMIYMTFTSNQISSLVPPIGMGGGGGQEAIPTLDPNRVVPQGCPSGWPVNSPGTEITQGPDTTLSHKNNIKESIDIAVWTGTAVIATHPGIAIKGESDGAGHVIELHGVCKSTSFSTYYGHLSSYNFDGEQKEVRAGDIIGFSGNTGSNTTGAHLHYQLNGLGDINQYLPKAVRRGCENACGNL